MIGKIMIGKSFRGCISYCMENKKIKQENNLSQINRAEVLLFNQCFGNTKELVQQFNETRQLNQKLSKPVLHITLSLAPGEKLEKGNLINMVQDCAKHFGFENNQFIAIIHNDTGHQHLHIVANRIGFDKKTISDSNSYKKMAAYCRQMEIKYDLQKVLSPKKFLPKELRKIPRIDTRKEAIKKDIQNALLLSKTYNDFESYLKDKKYQIIKGRGIAFIDKKGVYVKGSEVGYSLATIEKILLRSPEHKQIIISMQKEKDSSVKKQWQQQSLNQEQKISNKVKNDLDKIADILLKPEITDNYIPNALLEKKKKKKYLSI
ncbi:MAG TPA: relaxase/mobilization nuclease domain-containing protein [Chitinophagaceae bacterium]